MANKEIKRPASAATESGPDSKVSNNNSSRLSAEKQVAKKYFSDTSAHSKEIKRPVPCDAGNGPIPKLSNNNSSRLSAEKQVAKKYFSDTRQKTRAGGRRKSPARVNDRKRNTVFV